MINPVFASLISAARVALRRDPAMSGAKPGLPMWRLLWEEFVHSVRARRRAFRRRGDR